LNSTIISSQAGSRSRSALQNDWERLALNSATLTALLLTTCSSEVEDARPIDGGEFQEVIGGAPACAVRTPRRRRCDRTGRRTASQASAARFRTSRRRRSPRSPRGRRDRVVVLRRLDGAPRADARQASESSAAMSAPGTPRLSARYSRPASERTAPRAIRRRVGHGHATSVFITLWMNGTCCRRCPGCCVRRSRCRAASATRAPRRRRWRAPNRSLR